MTSDYRKIMYNSGDIFLPKYIIKQLDKYIYTTQNHSFYINGWSILHFISGVVIGAIYLYLHNPFSYYFYIMLLIHTLWELWQIFIGMSKPWKLTGYSNLIDTFVDTMFFLFGSYLIFQIYKNL